MDRIIRCSVMFLIFILIILGLTIQPVYSQGGLEVRLIPQDDQVRQKGIMILCPDESPCSETTRQLNSKIEVSADSDFIARYKVSFRANGVNIDPDQIICTVVLKEVCTVKVPQFNTEEEGTELINVSDKFICKYRQAIPTNTPGVGVIDLYYIGATNPASEIGDHVLRVEAKANRPPGPPGPPPLTQQVTGSDISDLCVLGFPVCRDEGISCTDDHFFSFEVVDPSVETFIKSSDSLFPFASCEDAAVWQREVLDLPRTFCAFG